MIGIACMVVGAILIAIDYHRIASCSVAKVPPGCGLVLNIEGVGFALLFGGAVALIASFVLNALLNDDISGSNDDTNPRPGAGGSH
jgi:hypothetical protein